MTADRLTLARMTGANLALAALVRSSQSECVKHGLPPHFPEFGQLRVLVHKPITVSLAPEAIARLPLN
jgi:hypothetical protein